MRILTFYLFYSLLFANAASAFDSCQTPRTYSIVSVDSRFGVSTSQVRAAARRAGDMWHSASGKAIFKEDRRSPQIAISLVYSEAQEAHLMVKDLNAEGRLISQSVDIHNRHQKEINEKVEKHNRAVEELNRDFLKLSKDIERWNRNPSSSKSERERLSNARQPLLKRKQELEQIGKQLHAENAYLDKQRSELKVEQREYNVDRDMVKYVAEGVLSFHRAGVYKSSAGGETIEVFVFGDLNELKNVLAHEFGHALGIKHLADSRALMNAELSDSNRRLTLVSRADYRELQRICPEF